MMIQESCHIKLKAHERDSRRARKHFTIVSNRLRPWVGESDFVNFYGRPAQDRSPNPSTRTFLNVHYLIPKRPSELIT